MPSDPTQARDAASMTDITTRLRRLAEYWEKATGKRENLLTDAADVIDEQDAEIVRLQSLVDEYERPKA